jgi:putative ABC transport system permease protein
MSYIPLSWLDVGTAAVLVLVSGIISIVFRLGIERTLAVAAVRMLVQLGLIGAVLKLVFAQTGWIWVILVALVMVFVAGHEVWARQSSRLSGWGTFGLGTATLLFVSLLASAYVICAVIGLEPWYTPRVFVPVFGMILGSALTSVALALDTLTETAKAERDTVEARLALGASRFVAFETVVRRSMRTALMPLINAMAVAGVVALPGMMSGQIMAGIDPVQASRYQIVVMLALAGATALAALIGAFGGVALLTDRRHRLRLDRLKST